MVVLFAIGLYAVPEAFAATYTVENADGSSVPGCEPNCFIPATLTVSVGDTIVFANNDTAAHTSTAGTPADGPSGAWDSSMVMTGQSYSVTLDTAGTYPYFCMVHPWMEGTIIVGEGSATPTEPEPEPEPEPTPAPTTTTAANTVENAQGSSVPGCEPNCFICLLYTSPSPRDKRQSRMPSSA